MNIFGLPFLLCQLKVMKVTAKSSKIFVNKESTSTIVTFNLGVLLIIWFEVIKVGRIKINLVTGYKYGI